MFTALTWAIVAIIAAAMCYAYAGSRDVFHPVMVIGPMMAFMYAWMPAKLDAIGGLDGFFQRDQLNYVQIINTVGVVCFLMGALSVGCRLPAVQRPAPRVSPATLVTAGTIMGSIGIVAWVITVIHGTGGDLSGYRGGWDDSGYIRDASMLMFPAFLLIASAAFIEGFRILYACLMLMFMAPGIIEAVFSARRGPTFMIAVMLSMGWYLNVRKRPALLATGIAGLVLGSLMLFLVSNRRNIYLGSDRELTTDVTSIVERPDTGNEFIYGAGTILSTEQRDSFFWGRRYLAQILIRPIPSSVWPTKYEDFGLSELTHNAGTGEGFAETLGWEGAGGSAPGIIADVWLEFHWLDFPVLFLFGRLFSLAWRKSQLDGGPWITQYIVLSALSIYFVMQTMEAIIFRLLILSVPMQLAWRFAREDDKIPPPVRYSRQPEVLTAYEVRPALRNRGGVSTKAIPS
jgi:hypothetical protein